jgi:hypothetical protein
VPSKKKNAEPAVEQDAAIQEAERQLIEKYGNAVCIVPGSLRPAGGRPEFGNKRTVVIKCNSCGKERTLATSDVFHCHHCLDCSGKAKKAKKVKEAGTESPLPSEPPAVAAVPGDTLHRVRLHDAEHDVDLARLAELLQQGEETVLVATNTRLRRAEDGRFVWSRDGEEHGPYRRPLVCVKAALGLWPQDRS